MQIHDKVFETYLDSNNIQQKIAEMGSNMNADYSGQEIHFVCILNGAFMFSADLIKHITIPCFIHFLKVRSYEGTQSTGAVSSIIGLTDSLEGKQVVIIEDIVDTGATMQHVHKEINKLHPESLKVATLLLKPEAYKGNIKIDYLCFSIPNKFVVGYGLDYDGLGRNLKDIYQLKD